ncbi:carboxymuconolactone decarboxylase family protein [Cryptosporangium aurantiacum]|uniref:Alkylhydroperoxidase AhpD family core domain-containing protein n=1 Tax=Cryptosporangium aurantiacum TaxID=134849 RepID=A0A1M7KL14_9ACTN|nr:carboxymuconolactone decarboxylase family protein [Cryptosporangium aurantiacum]SHM66067.1 alkylhydroperoxidase AhpD family core domain-containing protein [Cryptosporangium aurantiacum]
MSRIPPVPPADWSPELRTFITEFRDTVRGDKAAEGRPNGANLLGVLANHPALTTAFLQFNGHLLYGSPLPGRYRELVVLRVAWLRRCDYEWAQHVIQAYGVGISDDEIDRVADGPDAPGWTALERALLTATDELLDEGAIGGVTWRELHAELDDQQLLDVVFTVGTYDMLAKAMRTVEVELDDDLKPYLHGRG